MDFCEEGSAKGLAAEGEDLLVLRSMTKFYALPGLRLGYGIAAPPVIARLAEWREPWSVNTLAQAAGLVSLADPGYAAATREFVARERERLRGGLGALPGVRPFPSAANYLLVELTAGPSAGELAERLLAERILIRDCANFHGLSDRFFRVAVRSSAQDDRLLAALARQLPG
jgi:threonine-phosphate decarboxylase